MQFNFGKRTVRSIAKTRRCSSFPPLLKHSFSRITLAEPGRLGLRLSFPKPMQSKDFSTSKTLQNSKIYNEIDTTTLKCQLKTRTSAFRSLTAAIEGDTNQTSQQSRKWQIFHIRKMYLGTQRTLGDSVSLNVPYLI